MYKLLISDDEIRVCKFIQHLIDWESFGIEVIGLAQDGETALKIAKREHPELMITDIRMPGMDGLELIREIREAKLDTDIIIISGYKQFDYAQQAIRYGVEDYIVKPIDERELTSMVRRILEKRGDRQTLLTEKEEAEQQLKANWKMMQSAYLQQLISGSMQDTSEEKFPELSEVGEMTAVLVKPDIDCAKEEFSIYDTLLKKINAIAETVFSTDSIQCMTAIKDEGVYLIVNYTDRELLRANVRLLKRQIMVQNGAFFPKFTITVGIGTGKQSIKEIRVAIEEAEAAILNRLFLGTGDIIEADHGADRAVRGAENAVRGTHQFNRTAERAIQMMEDQIFTQSIRAMLLEKIEIFDAEGVVQIVRSIGTQCYEAASLDGSAVRRICKSVLNTYLFGSEIIRGKEDPEEFRFRWNRLFCMCATCREVFEELGKYLKADLERLLERKTSHQLRPIRDAKLYLQEHYKEQVYLEAVAKQAGFNPAYFSTLFKKETGQTFSDYLIELRIAGAKSLLTEGDQPIADIAEEVGYTDLKYFSRIFKRTTGLTPSEYRKLYHKVR